MDNTHAPHFHFTAASRPADEAEYFARDLTDAELAQYARRTTKRPLLCFLAIAAMPFVAECLCRMFRVW